MKDELEYSYNVLKFDLTAGLTDLEVPIHAQRIDYVSPTDGPELSIRLQRKSNDQLPLRPNGSIEAPFTRLYISAAATPRTVFLMVGAPAGVRVTGRDVALSGSVNTNISRDYLAYLNSQGQLYERTSFQSVAATFGNLHQFINPAGSGKTMELLFMEYTCDTNVATLAATYGQHNTALATLVGVGKSHVLGAPDGMGEVRIANSGVLATPWGSFGYQANAPRRFDLAVTLDPGEGFATSISLASAGLVVTCRWVWKE